jgi:spore coat polysaccharide biosynthesis predicted glycosyltransferase SpsG
MNRESANSLTQPPLLHNGSCPECRKPKVWIRTAAGPAIGFGHLRRSIALARLLEAVAQPIFLSDPRDEWTPRECAGAGWCCREFRSGCLGLDSPAIGIVIVDTREPEGLDELLREAHERKVTVVSIHDLGLNPIESDVVIDGSVMPGRGAKPDAVNYLGTEYLVLHPMYSEVNRRARRLSAEISSVFVNLGGGDARRFFPALLDGLRSWKPAIGIVAVSGFGSWGRDMRDDFGIRWAGTNDPVWELFHEADAAITAGGLSSFEALCCGTPLLALSHDLYQQATVSALAQEGLCLDLGPGDCLEPSRIAALMDGLEQDLAGRERKSAAGKLRVDGRGAVRVSRILEHLLAGVTA